MCDVARYDALTIKMKRVCPVRAVSVWQVDIRAARRPSKVRLINLSVRPSVSFT